MAGTTDWLSSIWVFTAAYFGSIAGIILFFHSVFRNADDGLDATKRIILAKNLDRFQNSKPSDWVIDFNRVFDKFFGASHLSWRCFGRSAIISIIFYYFVTLLFGYFDNWTASGMVSVVLVVAILAAMFNVVIDYISLLETRYLLNSSYPLFVILITDIALTLFLSIAWIALVSCAWLSVAIYLEKQPDVSYIQVLQAIYEIAPELMKDELVALDNFFSMSVSTSEGGLYGIYLPVILTSLSTSIWLWLHGVSQFTIKVLSSAATITRWLNVKEKPVQSIATVMNLYILLISLIFYPFLVMNINSSLDVVPIPSEQSGK